MASVFQLALKPWNEKGTKAASPGAFLEESILKKNIPQSSALQPLTPRKPVSDISFIQLLTRTSTHSFYLVTRFVQWYPDRHPLVVVAPYRARRGGGK